MDGKLQRTIKCEDSMWLLEGGKFIIVNLEKREERFWTAVLEGDAEIDKTKVDTTRDISDFDEQTQSDFEHVMYDHRQKLQGKPTSQELVSTVVMQLMYCTDLYHRLISFTVYVPLFLSFL